MADDMKSRDETFVLGLIMLTLLDIAVTVTPWGWWGPLKNALIISFVIWLHGRREGHG